SSPRGRRRPVGSSRARGARCCRHCRRVRNRRPAVTRRRLSPAHRQGVRPPESGGITVTAAIFETTRMTGRHLRFFSRQPYFIGIFLVQPVIWLLLFGALFQNVINIPGFGWEGSYLDYLVPGVLVMTALFSCGWAG